MFSVEGMNPPSFEKCIREIILGRKEVKSIGRMPGSDEPKKGAESCEKSRGVANRR